MYKKILISAGGTGGHILPALSLAESLLAQDNKLQIEFVSGSSSLEKSMYSLVDQSASQVVSKKSKKDKSSPCENRDRARNRYKIHYLPVGRLRKNVGRKERWKTIIFLPFLLLKALGLILRVKPTLLVGTGGAVSGPLLLAGFLLCKKTVIFEPNALPGLTNRWLSRFVNEVIVVFPSTKKYLYQAGLSSQALKSKELKRLFSKVMQKLYPLGMKKQTQFPFPVRSQICKVSPKPKPDSPLRILVLGGSQGSSLINKVVSEFITSMEKTEIHIAKQVCSHNKSFAFVHQTGEKEFEYFKKLYTECKQVRVFPFLQEIHKFYEWSDIVIGRAGAGAIAELSVVGRAGILVPLSSSADQHQLRNAQNLKQKSAIILIEEKNFNKHKLGEILNKLLNQPEKIKHISTCIHQLKLGAKADNMAHYLRKNYICFNK